MDELTIMEARKKSFDRLQTEIGSCAKYLEREFGMDHVDACKFVSKIMNLGIAIQEKHDLAK